MKTEKLIDVLVSDLPRRRARPGPLLLAAVLASIVFAGVALFATIGVRPDVTAAMQSGRLLFKLVVTVAVAASAFALVRRFLYPETANAKHLWLLLIGPGLLAVGVVVELLAVDASGWSMAAIGKNWYLCLTVVPALGIVPLALIIQALRQGAPARPALAGLCAGVLAGGIAATFYAVNCTDDSPLFVATWYPLAIGILAAVGGILGHRFLRW
jgi:hypothetical protein